MFLDEDTVTVINYKLRAPYYLNLNRTEVNDMGLHGLVGLLFPFPVHLIISKYSSINVLKLGESIKNVFLCCNHGIISFICEYLAFFFSNLNSIW